MVEEDGSGEIAVTVLLGETVRGALSEGGFVTEDPGAARRILVEEGPEALRVPHHPDPVDVLTEAVPAGWRHERLDQGKIHGLRVTTTFETLSEIPDLLEPFDHWGDEILSRSGGAAVEVGVGTLLRGFSVTREGTLFRLQGEPDVEAYAGATGGPNNLDADFTISVSLPGGIREHDADEKDGSRLTWRIPPGKARSISATSDLAYHPRNVPVVPVAVGASAMGTAGLLFWRARRERRLTAMSGDSDP